MGLKRLGEILPGFLVKIESTNSQVWHTWTSHIAEIYLKVGHLLVSTVQFILSVVLIVQNKY
jgi:hypothetical protein